MDNDRITVVDSFPACPKKKRILMYYTVRSKRITVVSFGSRYLLLYANKKKIKRFVLPESVTCGTIISTPRSAGVDSDGKVLVCGTCHGSIFMLGLPSTREQLKHTSDEISCTAYSLVYKYDGMEILCIACVEGRILAVGKDGLGERQILLFEASIMEDVLSQLQGNAGENTVGRNFEAVPLTPPSISTSASDADPELIVFRSEHTRGSPYHNSLDCIQYLDENLFRGIFRFAACDALAPVACFFFPGGEVWYRALQGRVVHHRDLEHLCNLAETCSLVTVAEISGRFLQRHGCDSVMGDAEESMAYLLLFGHSDNVCVVKAGQAEPGYQHAPDVFFVTYPADVKARLNDWHSLLSLPFMYLRYLRGKESGVTSSSVFTNFSGEQRIGLDLSSEIWTFQDESARSSLVSIQISNPFDHEYVAGTSCEIQDFLDNLESLNLEHEALQSKSSKLSHALGAVEQLCKVLNGPGGCAIAEDFMKLHVKCEKVQYPDGEHVNINIKVPSDGKNSLSNFVYELHVAWRSEGAPSGHTNIFAMNDDCGADTNLCIPIEKEEFLGLDSKEVKMTVFLNLLSFKNVDASGHRDLSVGFPVLLSIHSCVVDLAL